MHSTGETFRQRSENMALLDKANDKSYIGIVCAHHFTLPSCLAVADLYDVCGVYVVLLIAGIFTAYVGVPTGHCPDGT